MLFCEGILLEPFETRVSSREQSILHRGESAPVCYEAAAPNKDIPRLEKIGMSQITLTWEFTFIILLPFKFFLNLPFNCILKYVLPLPSLSHFHPPFLLISLAFPSIPFSSFLSGLVSVYGQCKVTVCRRVTECRPASEGLGPAYRTTHWLQGSYSHRVRGKEKGMCVSWLHHWQSVLCMLTRLIKNMTATATQLIMFWSG